MKKRVVLLGTLAVVALAALIFTGAVLAQGPQGDERHLGYRHGYMYADGDGVGDLCGIGQGYGRDHDFVDADGDGVCDNFVDADGDGVCDLKDTEYDMRHGRGSDRVNGDCDGTCDYYGSSARTGRDSRSGRTGVRRSAGR
ncbi:MAG: hypothetical protein SVX38_11075 [Chloroflexota bacterium]|nr:hypothetical protein [Chloroflexota bacterium]